MRIQRTIAITLALALFTGCGSSIRSGADAGDDTGADTPPADTQTDGDDDPVDDSEEDPAADTTPDITADTATDTATDPLPDGDCTLVQIPFEAEDMTFDEGFGTRESSRGYIGWFLESLTANAGTASIDIDVPCTDTWVLWGLVWWEGTTSDSFYFSWDASTDRWVWDLMQQCDSPPVSTDWHWDQVSLRHESSPPGYCGPTEEDPALFSLDAGTHTFHLYCRERLSAVDEFILTNDLAYVPPDPG